VGVVRAHPVRAYFVITYIVSWSYWLLIHGLLDKDSYWWAAPGVFMPALAAILVTEALGGCAFVVIVFVGGCQEEPGWRGFALPRLQQRFGPVRGSVPLGTL
jgi:membrane protease YdiL (CAAX protease family)